MTAPVQPLSEITEEAVAVLVRELGLARTLRFFAQFQSGHGDYTADRSAWMGDVPPLDDLIREARGIDAARSSAEHAAAPREAPE